jgi:hypothetical protein
VASIAFRWIIKMNIRLAILEVERLEGRTYVSFQWIVCFQYPGWVGEWSRIQPRDSGRWQGRVQRFSS